MSSSRVKKLCQKLKSEATEKQDTSAENDLRLQILDYFISQDIPDDLFEMVLNRRIYDPDPQKEISKVICTQILEAWQSRRDALTNE